MGEVHGVDLLKKRVLFDERSIEFDYLVLATGARHSYFGHENWEENAPGLKSIEDATEIRRKILLAFEHDALLNVELEKTGDLLADSALRNV